MSKKISVIIPCYNQTKLLERNFQYLSKQTLKNFDIVILDDHSTEDYQEVISKFPDLDITYVRNEKNLGAIANIFNSIFYKTASPYKISLHEDDILHPQYLEKAVEILEKNNKIAFVVTLAEWFKDVEELEEKFKKAKDLTSKMSVVNKADFIREILDGKHIMLGSVVYRNSALNKKPDLGKYDVLCDRPFLASLIENNLNASLLEDKGMFVRDHGEDDHRFDKVTEENCFNLMSFYKDNLPHPISTCDYKKLLTFSTNNLINAYSGLRNKKMKLNEFIKAGKMLDLINLKYINKIGVVGTIRLLLGEKITSKLIKLFKK